VSTWKNKHVIIATMMAPVLALIAYFGINALVGEKPHAAEAGQSYELIEKPNCRRSGGFCGLKNGDFELNLSFERLDANRLLLKLESAHPLDGVMAALVENESDGERPWEMRPLGNDGLTWSLEIARPDPERQRMHLVASANEVLYFGDASMKFSLIEP
jgi:hypothetical protein